MGARTTPNRPMAWQATLGGMLEQDVTVRHRCAPCGTWDEVSVLEEFLMSGPEFTLWDLFPPCERCGLPTTFHASPGPGTPFLPLRR